MKFLVVSLYLLLAVPVAADADGVRVGFHIAGGARFPEATWGGGGGFRLGVQRGRVGFLVELGGFGGFSRDAHDTAGARVSAMFAGGLTPTVEIDLDERAFASAGLVLDGGMWAHTTHATDADGTVRSESGGTVGSPFLHFLPGIDLRMGWRVGTRHHLRLGFGLQVLFAHGHVATATVSSDGATRTASDVRELGFVVWPSFIIGWDFKR